MDELAVGEGEEQAEDEGHFAWRDDLAKAAWAQFQALAPQQQHQARNLIRAVQLGAPGVGLGLSVVSAVARLHGGTLLLADNRPGLRATLQVAVSPAGGTQG